MKLKLIRSRDDFPGDSKHYTCYFLVRITCYYHANNEHDIKSPNKFIHLNTITAKSFKKMIKKKHNESPGNIYFSKKLFIKYIYLQFNTKNQ